MELDYAIVSYLKGELGSLASQKVKKLIATNEYFSKKANEWKPVLQNLEDLKEREYKVPSGYREALMEKIALRKNNKALIGALAVIPVIIVGLGVYLLKRKKVA